MFFRFRPTRIGQHPGDDRIPPDTSHLPDGSRFFQVLFVTCVLCLTIDEAVVINDCPAKFDLELFLMTGTALPDFAARLDKTAEDTEALLAKLLSDATLPDEIVRPKRLMDAIRYSSLNGGKR